jgi:O-antigen ligase
VVNSTSKHQMGSFLLVAAPLVTFVISPWLSYEGIDIPKLSALVLCAAILLALLLSDFRILLDSRYRISVIVSAIFKIDLLLVLFSSSSPFNEQFFGANGRNTGYLTYVCLLVIFFTAVVSLDKKKSEKLVWSLLIIGALSVVYGLMQSMKLDPFKWNNPYSPVLGFLGNPDFQSSFLGICAVAALALLFAAKASPRLRAGLVVYLLLSAYVIAKTKAQQGFLVFVAGGAVVLFIVLYKNKSTEKLSFAYLPFALASGVLVAFGSLNKGPLGPYLFKVSVTYRGDYWRAGWKMTTEHPLTGVGLDSYGNWYRSTRTLAATLRRGPEQISNAAHNVFLDFSASGGFPLLLAYLLIVGYAFISVMKVVRRTEGFDAVHIALFGAWIAYQVQSLISLNQIGLAIWGWVLSGALVAYEISTRTQGEVPRAFATKAKSKGRNVKVQKDASPATTLIIVAGVVVGLALGLPPFIADASLRSALQKGDATALIKSVKKWPIDEIRLVQVAQILASSKLEAQALELDLFAAKRDLRLYYAWQGISTNSTASPTQKSNALAHMKMLDPHNPTLK